MKILACFFSLFFAMLTIKAITAKNKAAVVGVRITSLKSGNWNSASTWDVKIPTGQDTVVINNNNVITLDGNCYLHYLKSNTGGRMIFTATSNLIYQ